MKCNECRPMDEVFTHLDEDGVTVRHINASAMLRAAPEAIRGGVAEVITVEFDPEFMAFVRKHRGIEQPRVDRLQEPYLSLPAMGFWMPSGAMLTVDGHHRMVRLYEEGKKEYRALVFQYSEIGKYCIEDMPEDLGDTLCEIAQSGVSGG